MPDRPQPVPTILDAPETTNVFIGWSGEISHQVALAVRDWLPNVIQNAKPFVSSEDIAKGQSWRPVLDEALTTADAAMFCISEESLDSKWIHFEAGRLSADRAVTPFLFCVAPSQFDGPLSDLQASTWLDGQDDHNRSETLKMLKSIRTSLDSMVDDHRIEATLDKWFPDLAKDLSALAAELAAGKKGATREGLTDSDLAVEEILSNTREIQRSFKAMSSDFNLIRNSIVHSRPKIVYRESPVGRPVWEFSSLEEMEAWLALQDPADDDRSGLFEWANIALHHLQIAFRDTEPPSDIHIAHVGGGGWRVSYDVFRDPRKAD